MQPTIYLKRYRVAVDQVGIPIVLRRSAGEATFQADDLQNGERVALQVVPPAARRSTSRDQLETEARAALQIEHGNIPRLRDFGFENEQLILVTEYFSGTTAEDWVRTKGTMPVSVVLRIAAQVVSALGAAAFHGLRQPAVQPANLVLAPGPAPDGEWPLIKLLNLLGVAPEKSFVSPEEAATGAADFRSQIYSLGKTLWFLLRGTAFAGGAAEVEDALDLPVPLRRLLARMLAQNPAERPSDPVLLQEQIAECAKRIEQGGGRRIVPARAALEQAAETAATFTEARRRPPRLMPAAIAALLLALATLASVVVVNRSRPTPPIGLASTAEATPSPNEQIDAPAAEIEPEPTPATIAAKKADVPSASISPADDPPPPAEGPEPEAPVEMEPTAAAEAPREVTITELASVPETSAAAAEIEPTPQPSASPQSTERRRSRRPVKLPVLRALPPD